MKRSEAILKITQHIKDQLNYEVIDGCISIDSYKLLDFIEKEIGMEPKPRKNPHYSSGWESEYSRINQHIYGWEPE